MPMITEPLAVTKPQAGVMTTRPATAPEQKPRMLGLPRVSHSIIGQTNEATAVASVVVVKALAAMPSAATALPALKPYQPTQSMPVPTMQSTMLCGGIGVLPKPRRGPMMIQRIDRKSTRLNSSHTEIYTLSLHDALPISADPEHARADHAEHHAVRGHRRFAETEAGADDDTEDRSEEHTSELQSHRDLHSFPTRRSSDLSRPRACPCRPCRAPCCAGASAFCRNRGGGR